MQIFTRVPGRPSLVLQLDGEGATIGDVKASLLARHAAPWASAGEMRVVHGGRDLGDECTLAHCNIMENSTLEVMGRLRGGGGDGGVTGAENRDAYLEMYMEKKADKVNPLEERAARFVQCTLSGDVLVEPVVVDEMGNLFNKESVIHALVHKNMPRRLGYIKSLKDVINLKLTPNESDHKAPAVNIHVKGNTGPPSEAQWRCPISGQEFNGRFKFVVFRPTGEVFSEKAVKEMGTGVLADAGGKKEFAEGELQPINPFEEEVITKLFDKVVERQAAAAAVKAAKKAAKSGGKAAAAAVDEGPEKPSVALPGKEGKRKEAEKRRQGWESLEQEQDIAKAKKFRAWDTVPDNSDKSVYASIFTSSTAGLRPKETYGCRNYSARGHGV
mmetsp:Transcript_43847/g.139734  ORF Transcript_43847/g.139734 Transcript_43847/m.139734 type:complete len:386 (-) Transcript_43847:97-1254(-)